MNKLALVVGATVIAGLSAGSILGLVKGIKSEKLIKKLEKRVRDLKTKIKSKEEADRLEREMEEKLGVKKVIINEDGSYYIV